MYWFRTKLRLRQQHMAGQTLVEYATILLVVGVASVLILALLQPTILNTFRRFIERDPVAPPSLGGIGNSFTPAPPTIFPTIAPTATQTPIPTATVDPITGTHTPVPNQPPVLDNPGLQSSDEGELISLTMSATDVDLDPLYFVAVNLPPGLSINSSTGVISGTIAAYSAGFYTANVTVGDGVSGNATVAFSWSVKPAVIDLVMCMMMDDGGGIDALDSSPFSNHGELTNGVSWATGRIVGGLNFDGVDDYVSVASDGSQLLNDQLTMAAWVNADTLSNGDGILVKGTSNSPYSMHLWGDGSIRFSANRGSLVGATGQGSWNSTGTIATGGWHHIAVTYDGANVRFYIDGVLDTDIVAGTLVFGTTVQGITVGADLVDADYFDGNMDDARLYGRALTDSEIATIVGSAPTLNQNPIMGHPGDQTDAEGDSVGITISASDPDGDTLIYTVSGLPAGLSIGANTGIISGTIGSGTTGIYSVTVTATDPSGATANQTFTWTVNPATPPCGGLVQEAESGVLHGNMVVGSDGSASGGQYVYAPPGTGFKNSLTEHRVEYCFTVTTPGTYRIKAWQYAANGDDNSFWVTVNGLPGSGNLWDTAHNTNYDPDYVNHRYGDDPVEVILGVGDHVIKVYQREDGTRLDKLQLEPVNLPTGVILHEWWSGISGSSVSDLTGNADYPANPTDSNFLTSFEAPLNWADQYGQRIRGYVYPPVSGDYTFWIASDDASQLYLSTDDSTSNASVIASVSTWTNSQEWDKFSSQQSATISLVAGQRYYIEAIAKDGWGGDNLAVAWQYTGQSRTVIPGAFLSPATGYLSTNLAFGASVSQSSTGYGGLPQRAVDGNAYGEWSSNSVTHTFNDPEAWWEVDLGAVYDLDNVRIWNRTDCCSSRLSDFHIFVSDVPFVSQTVAGTQAQSGVTDYHFTGTAGTKTVMLIGRTGRYVRIQLSGTNYLNLAEVQVFEDATASIPYESAPVATNIAPVALQPTVRTEDRRHFA